MLRTALTAAWLAALAWSPIGASVAGWAGTVGQGWTWPLGPAVALAICAGVVALLWQIDWWPSARLFRSTDDAPTGRRREARSVWGVLRSMGVAAAAALAGGGVMWSAAVMAGPWWWAVAGALVAAALVAAMHVGPGLLARGSGARAVDRAALVEQLGALARQVRVPIASIDGLPASATLTSTALVAGAGAARRVFIAHELLRDWSDDEIAVVVAHEFAHHAHHDLWRTLVVDVAAAAAGLWAAAGVLRATGLAPNGVPADLRALPAAALVAGAVWLGTAPLRHALSRRQERRADVFALQLTRRSEPFQAAIRRLAARHLAEERPSPLTRWFFHRHPTPEERLRLADDFGRRSR